MMPPIAAGERRSKTGAIRGWLFKKEKEKTLDHREPNGATADKGTNFCSRHKDPKKLQTCKKAKDKHCAKGETNAQGLPNRQKKGEESLRLTGRDAPGRCWQKTDVETYSEKIATRPTVRLARKGAKRPIREEKKFSGTSTT